MRILFLSRWFPFPPNNGTKLRINSLLKGLSLVHEVTLISFSDQPQIDRLVKDEQAICNEILVVPWHAYDPKSTNSLFGFFNPAPRSIVDTFSQEMVTVIKETLSKKEFDLIIASSITMASYADHFGGLPAVFEELELGVPYHAIHQKIGFFHSLRNLFTWIKLKNYLSNLLVKFKACTVVSEEEHLIFSKTFPNFKRIFVIPNCIDFKDYPVNHEEPDPCSVIFTGSFKYSANYDAMVWFVSEIFPRVLSRNPNVHLYITGDHANLELPECDHVNLTGYVDDIKPIIAKSWCSIVPLRVGGGTRLKILEAMALKTPVISTSKGAEGLGLVNGIHYLVADSPEDFVNQMIKLLTDIDLRRRLAENAYNAAHEKYDCSKVIPQFLQLINGVKFQ